MTSLQNYDLDEAASILRCFRSYLEENLRNFPHQKIGKAVAFDDAELAEIKEMHRKRPPEEPPAAESSDPEPAALTLATIRPSERSRRRTG